MLKKTAFLVFLSVWLPCFGEDFFSKLCLEEKVGQLLMVHFQGDRVNENAKILVQKVKVGGIIYYNWANGLESPQQVRALSQGLQDLAQANLHSAPLFIAVDQEGGIVARLTKGFTKFPGQRALAETQNPELAEWMGEAVSEELQAVGVNMNLAPVVDVNSNPRNPVIGVRSFGEDPGVVSIFGEKILKGFQKKGMIGTLKHFPGHGDTGLDSHLDLPTVLKSQDELEKTELVPFQRLALLADAIMTAHILVPALDPDCCSTLSRKTLKYLRDKIGFQGVIVADSLVMGGVLKTCGTVDEAAIQAIQAGCDLLILGGKFLVGEKAGLELTAADIERVHQSIIRAVKEKRISEERIDEAAKRVLDLKRKRLAFLPSPSSIEEKINTSSHRAIAQQIASQACKIIGTAPSLKDQKVAIFASDLLKDSIDQTSLMQIGKSAELYLFSALNPSQREMNAASELAKNSDTLLICSYNAWKNPLQIALIQTLLDTGKPAILLVLRDPLDASLFPSVPIIFNTFNPTAPSIQAVCDELMKK